MRRDIAAERSAANFRATSDALERHHDLRRGEFLRAIDSGVENLSQFEMDFIESFLGDRALKDAALDWQWFTEGRRKVVDNMIHRYGFRSLKMEAAAVNRLPPSAPGKCGYLVRPEPGRPQQRCGAAAVIKLRNGLELCNDCNQIREDGIAKLRAARERQLRS